ncbi:family 79 glycoside hydrolase [Phakopsora pachyrhizi]|uniref:Family 79 glycoside hydrolase n=1 Tax=Phakopsora pachyrhizi TaxID=170000 RepID=A0AAV0BMZ6_PHAPC|nr:family 79 glycoside hydrolase [Phakopsora pachyrhizi]
MDLWLGHSSSHFEVDNTKQCLKNLESALGSPMAFRIGGATQDRAAYDPNLSVSIKNNLTKNSLVPNNITYGPKYFQIANQLDGPTTIGVNRRENNLNNTINAVQEALRSVKNLYAIELGNEPEFWDRRSPITQNSAWNTTADAESQILWQKEFLSATGKYELVQAGNYLKNDWSVSKLAQEIWTASMMGYVKSFGRHAYPQNACGTSKTSLPELMSHKNIVQFLSFYANEAKIVDDLKFPYHLSETNSATCGGGEVSATIGAGLWLVDYTLQALKIGVSRIYFHQGTVGDSPYSFWGNSKVSATYYGVFFVSLALKRVNHFNILNTSDANMAAYAFYRGNKLLRLLIYNSKYYSSSPSNNKNHEKGKGTKSNNPRPFHYFILNDLSSKFNTGSVLRFTASDAHVQQTNGTGPTLGKSQFLASNCSLKAPFQYEKVKISNSRLTVKVKASEAVLISFSQTKSSEQ